MGEVDPIARLAALGRAGLTVSVCVGPSGPMGRMRWSVQVMNGAGVEFDRPYAADTFEQAVWIAEHESAGRGWAK